MFTRDVHTHLYSHLFQSFGGALPRTCLPSHICLVKSFSPLNSQLRPPVLWELPLGPCSLDFGSHCMLPKHLYVPSLACNALVHLAKGFQGGSGSSATWHLLAARENVCEEGHELKGDHWINRRHLEELQKSKTS